jgi:hypothetical protein
MSKTIFGFDQDRQWDYENGFYLTSHINRLGKLLAHYELYKSITHLPGHIVECGVFKGSSFIRFATYRSILESPFSRKLIGFNTFNYFPKQTDVDDQKFIDRFQSEAGRGISVGELAEILSQKSIEDFELIQGDIIETVPQYVLNHPELVIALLHIDVDVYEPSKVILQHLFDKVVSGGIVILDDYGTIGGETRAVNEFIVDRNLSIEKLPLSHIPAFIRKK